MRKPIERDEIRRRALRAAAAVAMTWGTGCSATLDEPAQGPADAAFSDSAVTLRATDAQADTAKGADSTATEVAAADTADAPDAGLEPDATTADAGSAAEADTVAALDGAGDTGGHKCVKNGDDWQAYNDCCQAVNWDWDAGCMAWGPPMPVEVA